MGVKITLGENSGPTFYNEKTGNREPKDESLRKEMGLPPYSSRWINNDNSEKTMSDKTDKTLFWTYIGEGIGIMLIITALCFGIGGCNYLVQKGKSLNNTSPTVEKN